MKIYPQTSLIRDRTALVLLLRIPFLREGRGGSSRRRTIWPLFMPTAMPSTELVSTLSERIFAKYKSIMFIDASITSKIVNQHKPDPQDAENMFDLIYGGG